ncbi:MAG: tetratricopeptide repeat protein [Pirellulaceae bacterium]
MKNSGILIVLALSAAGCGRQETPLTDDMHPGNSPTQSIALASNDGAAPQEMSPVRPSSKIDNQSSNTEAVANDLVRKLEVLNGKANQAQAEARFNDAVGHWTEAIEVLNQLYGSKSWQTQSAVAARQLAFEQSQLTPEQHAQFQRIMLVQNQIANEIKQNNVVNAKELSLGVTQDVRNLFANDSLMVAKQKMQLARLFQMNGDNSQAVDMYRESLDVQTQYVGELHPDVESIHAYLAECFSAKGEWLQALENLKVAARMAREMWGEDSLQYALRANDLGVAFHRMKDLTTAVKILRAAESIRRNRLGMDHPQVAHSLVNLASVYIDLNRHEMAKQSLEQALPTLEKGLGADHLMVVDAKNKLGMTLMLLEQPGAAEPILRDVADSLKRTNAKPISIANAEFRLAVAMAKQGNYNDSEPLFVRSLEIQDREMGMNSPEAIRTRNALATLYRQTDRVELAERVASQVRQVNYEEPDSTFRK